VSSLGGLGPDEPPSGEAEATSLTTVDLLWILYVFFNAGTEIAQLQRCTRIVLDLKIGGRAMAELIPFLVSLSGVLLLVWLWQRFKQS
jgi:hypothetical protein